MRLHYLFLSILMLGSSILMGQQQVRGVVTQAGSEEPLVGVTILQKGINNGALSKPDGSFEITVRGENPVLIFSYIGFSKQEIPVDG